MADKVTEFVNRSDLTYSNLSAGLPVVTNATGETAVIKDIFTGSQPINFTLTNGTQSQTILSATANSVYSGTELIGTGSTVAAKVGAGILNNIYGVNGTTRTKAILTNTYFDGTVPTSFNGTSIGPSTAFTIGNTGYMWFDTQGRWWCTPNVDAGVNNTVQYCTKTSTSPETWGNLVTFTLSNVNPNTNNIMYCYDGQQYAYALGTNNGSFNLYSTDCSVGTPSNFSLLANTSIYIGANGVTSMAAVQRGNYSYIFIRTGTTTGRSDYLLVKIDRTNSNPATNFTTTASMNYYYPSGVPGSLQSVLIAQNGNYGYFLAPDANSSGSNNGSTVLLYWKYNFLTDSLVTDSQNPVKTSDGFSSDNWNRSSGRTGWVGADNSTPGNDETDIAFLYRGGSNQQMFIFDAVAESWTKLSTSSIPLFTNNFSGSGWALAPYFDTAKANIDFGTTSLRVTGIKTTP